MFMRQMGLALCLLLGIRSTLVNQIHIRLKEKNKKNRITFMPELIA